MVSNPIRNFKIPLKIIMRKKQQKKNKVNGKVKKRIDDGERGGG